MDLWVRIRIQTSTAPREVDLEPVEQKAATAHRERHSLWRPARLVRRVEMRSVRVVTHFSSPLDVSKPSQLAQAVARQKPMCSTSCTLVLLEAFV